MPSPQPPRHPPVLAARRRWKITVVSRLKHLRQHRRRGIPCHHRMREEPADRREDAVHAPLAAHRPRAWPRPRHACCRVLPNARPRRQPHHKRTHCVIPAPVPDRKNKQKTIAATPEGNCCATRPADTERNSPQHVRTPRRTPTSSSAAGSHGPAPAPSWRGRSWPGRRRRTGWSTSARSAPGSPRPSAGTSPPGCWPSSSPSRRSPPPLPADVARRARWTRPVLAAEVAYAEITPAGRMRHPVWRGLRPA
jgi:hypothetical protein